MPRWTADVRDAILEPAIGRDILALAAVRRPALLRQVFAVAATSPAQILSLQKIQGQIRDAGALETHAWNAGQTVTYWREEPLEVDGVTEGNWGAWAMEIKTGRFQTADLHGPPGIPTTQSVVPAPGDLRSRGVRDRRTSGRRSRDLADVPPRGTAAPVDLALLMGR